MKHLGPSRLAPLIMAYFTTRALSLLIGLLPLTLLTAVTHGEPRSLKISAGMDGEYEQPGRLGPKSQEDGGTDNTDDPHAVLDALSVNSPDAPREARPHGTATQGQARLKRVKRALLRATRRAQQAEDHTTLYRGRRMALAQLGGPAPANTTVEPRPRQQLQPKGRRVRILTKNVRGFCTTTHDVFMTWLTGSHNTYDIVLLQETHFGLGKTPTEYKIPGWSVISSPDPQHRWEWPSTSRRNWPATRMSDFRSLFLVDFCMYASP